MAEQDQEIKIKFDTNAAEAAKDTNKLGKSIDKTEDSAEKATKRFNELTSEIQEQKDLTIEFRKELVKLERQLQDTPKNAITAQKQLKGEISQLKNAIKDQNVAVQSLTNEKRKAVTADKKFKASQNSSIKSVIKNHGAIATLDRITGGYARVLTDAIKSSALFSGGMGKMLKAVRGFSTGAKAALIATGIGALVVLVGTLVTFWEDIKGLVTGVNGAMKEQGEITKDNSKEFQKQLDIINSQDNILKEQGKTEKEILDIKIKQTQETITALEAQLLSQETIKDAQVKATQRNKDILSGILQFVSLPITLLLKGIDLAGKAFGKNFGLSSGFDKIANLLFDPEEVEEKADEVIETTEKKLLALRNTVAGHRLSIIEINKEANEKELALAKEAIDKQIDLDKEAQKRRDEQIAREDADFLKLQELTLEKDEFAKLVLQQKLDADFIIHSDSKELQKELEIKFLEDIAAINLAAAERQAAEQKKIADRVLGQQKALQSSKRKLSSEALNLAKTLAGKNKTIQKGIVIAESVAGIAKSVISTQSANTIATAEGFALAIPTAGASVAAASAIVTANTISAGISIAANIAATSKALQALGGGGNVSGGGSSISSGGGSTPSTSAPSVAFNNSAENQIGQSIAKTQSEQPPLQVFVSESDISEAQTKVKVLVDENNF